MVTMLMKKREWRLRSTEKSVLRGRKLGGAISGRICYPRYDEHPGMHTGATRMHTGERPYGNPPYATATWHRRRYDVGAAPTTTAYRWFGPWFGLYI